MNDQVRKVVGVMLLAGIVAAAAFWLSSNGMWPFAANVPDPSVHNHPAFTYAQAGLKMDMAVRTKTDAGGTLASLAFKLTDVATGQPVKALEDSHGKPMHVVGMREGDLGQFFHIHPELKGDEWVAEYLVTQPGKYAVWPGISMGSSVVVEKMPAFTVGEPAVSQAQPEFSRTKGQPGGVQIALDAPAQMKAGQAALWEFKALDDSGRRVTLGTYLEAALHVNVVSADATAYQHLHTSYGMINPKDPDILQLSVKFTQAGMHKVFVEYVTLDAPNDAKLAEYWVEVLP